MRVLYILPSLSLLGGTPKKTLDLIRHTDNDCRVYVYGPCAAREREQFELAGARVVFGDWGHNVARHAVDLLRMIDLHDTQVVQTQFSMGEILGVMVRVLRPRVRLLVAFVGPFEPPGMKKRVASAVYRMVDGFVYVSNYVHREKTRQFPRLTRTMGRVIYNGTERRQNLGTSVPELRKYSLLYVAGLSHWKNASVLVEAMALLKSRGVHLYLVGDGLERHRLEELVSEYGLEERVHLLGYQENVGALFEACNAYVHPASAEGFGIAVAEAMAADKPIVVANQGALPELIENEVTGLVVRHDDPREWAEAIERLSADAALAGRLASKAKEEARARFSVSAYADQYHKLYQELCAPVSSGRAR